MTDKTRLGFSIMAAALVAGALGDGLLRATPWGMNLFVWLAALVALAAGVLILNRGDLDAGGRWLVIPLLFFAAAVAWRDSPVLKALNLIGIIITLAMILMRSRAGKLLVAGVTEYALGVLGSLFDTPHLSLTAVDGDSWAVPLWDTYFHKRYFPCVPG